MGSYSVELSTSAERDLRAISVAKDRRRVAERISGLAENPRGPGCEKLAGTGDRYRVRQGDYRILYEIRETIKVVAVVKIGHRREVYR